MKVVVNMSKYKDEYNFLAWVLRIARNLSIDHFRKESRKKTTPLVEEMDTPGSILDLPSSELEHGELGQAIAQAVETLPLEQREVFVLRQQNVPFKEIKELEQEIMKNNIASV